MRDTFVRKEQPRLENVRRNPLDSQMAERYNAYNAKYNDAFGRAVRQEITSEEYRREVKELDAEYTDVITAY